MKYRDFEEHIKTELSGATEMVNIDELINSIHAGNKTKKRGTYIIGLSLLFAISLFGFGIYFQTNKTSIQDTILPIESTVVNAEEKTDHSLTSVTSLKDQSKKDIELTIKNNQVSSQHKIEFSNSDNSPTNSSNINNSLSELTRNNTPSIEKSKLSELEEKNQNSNQNKTISEFLKPIETNTNDITNDLSKTELSSSINNGFIMPLSNLYIDNIHSNEENLPLMGEKIIDPIECFDFGFPVWTFELLGEVGVMNPYKTLTYSGPNINETFVQRKQSEKSLEGLQAAIYWQVSQEKIPFYVRIGASYSRISEKVELMFSNTQIDTSQGIISITVSQNSDTVTIIRGDVYTTTITDVKSKDHHYFHLIDIPLSIGYTKKFQEFNIGFEVGAQFNVFTKVTGKWLEGKNRINKVNTKNYFKPSVGISYYASLDVSRDLSYRHSLYMSTRFRYLPNNFSSKNNSINQKYSLLGLHIGYKYRL